MTIRRQIIEALKENNLSALELSQLIGIREREVYDHLDHIKRTISSKSENFIMTPSSCLKCGYKFVHRARLTKPSRCPRCKGTRLTRPTYRIV
jgi:predicted Zn-ribbon and HTH transcriptional regulator